MSIINIQTGSMTLFDKKLTLGMLLDEVRQNFEDDIALSFIYPYKDTFQGCALLVMKPVFIYNIQTKVRLHFYKSNLQKIEMILDPYTYETLNDIKELNTDLQAYKYAKTILDKYLNEEFGNVSDIYESVKCTLTQYHYCHYENIVLELTAKERSIYDR